MDNYGFISLPGNQISVITEKNQNTSNPTEYSATDTILLESNTPHYPGIWNISLPANQISTISQSGQRTNNPAQHSGADLLLKTTAYQSVNFAQNPNAFGRTYSFEQQNTLPQLFARTASLNYENSLIAQKKKIYDYLH